MQTPTVRFLLPALRKEADVLSTFLRNEKGGWDKRAFIFGRHPYLRERLEGVSSLNEVWRTCFEYARSFRRTHAEEFRAALETNERGWRPIEREFLSTLREHFEVDFPPHVRTMRAYVSLVPVYPRWLDTWSFNVSYFRPERVREIACHEIVHFLWFRKWKEVFPDSTMAMYNSPHLVWRLSEILDPVILNEHPVFRMYFDNAQTTYKHFQEIRLNGVRPTTYFARIYRSHLRAGAPFADFLKAVHAEGKRFEREIMAA